MPKAVFLDRDGVLNRNVFYADSGEWESPRTPQEFTLIDGVIPACARLQDAGYKLFIVTNQPSYAKGKTTLAALQETLELCVHRLHEAGIAIEKAYCSYSHPKSIVPELAGFDPYRKPSAQALLDAIRDFTLDASQCWMIGDRATDTQCAHNAGVKGIRVMADYEKELPQDDAAVTVQANLAAAVDYILSLSLF